MRFLFVIIFGLNLSGEKLVRISGSITSSRHLGFSGFNLKKIDLFVFGRKLSCKSFLLISGQPHGFIK